MSAAWSLDNPLFATFAFYSTVLAGKMMLMAAITGYYRMSRGVSQRNPAKMSTVWSLDNAAFASFAFYSTVLAVKVILMAPITGYYRMSRGAFANPEDAAKFGAKATKSDADVERVRRAHQNDLENIPVFFLIGSMYLLTNPSAYLANWLFRVFTVGRILHTVFYLNGSSLRPFGFIVPQIVSMYMAGSVLYHLW